MTSPARRWSRRALLTGATALGTAGWLGAACTPPSPPTPSPSTSSSETSTMPNTPRPDRVLLVYFSRPGENYFYGGRRDLEVGNTERLAQMIAELTAVDVHRIDAADPYPRDYDTTVARNVTEQNDNARPGIANPLDSIDDYTTVLLASPIWNVRPPMIMSTFTDAHDFTGKTVLPVVTYAVSGLGSTAAVYATACPGARIGDGLAVRGEEVTQQRSQVTTWLRDVGLTTR